MSNKAENLNKIINELPLCDKGKDGIRKLLKELGYEVSTQAPLRAGQVYIRADSGDIRLIVSTDGSMSVVGNNGHVIHSRKKDIEDMINNGGYVFASNSLEEYFNAKK